jgi:hypothetical protein
MLRYLLILIATVCVAANPPGKAAGDKVSPFDDYNGEVKIPESLKSAYVEFVKLATTKEPSFREMRNHLLPVTVTISSEKRAKEKTWNVKNDINLPFYQQHFSATVVNVVKHSEDAYLIRSITTSFYYVCTKSGKWVIYSTYDSHYR